MKFSIFCVISKNYISHLQTTLDSLRCFHSDLRAHVLLLDSPTGYFDPASMACRFYRLSEIGLQTEESRLAEKYDAFSIACIMKSKFAKFLLESAKEQIFFYVDTDLYFFSPIFAAIEALGVGNILLTPHLVEIKLQPSKEEVLREAKTNLAGIFNMGFFGLKKDRESLAFLDWWETRTTLSCYRQVENGLYDDQKWIDAAAHLFAGVKVFLHPGYNVANWNLNERALTKRGSGFEVNGREPLVFFHFSRFEPGQSRMLSRFLPIETTDFPCLAEICETYNSTLMRNGWRESRQWPFYLA